MKKLWLVACTGQSFGYNEGMTTTKQFKTQIFTNVGGSMVWQDMTRWGSEKNAKSNLRFAQKSMVADPVSLTTDARIIERNK